MMNPISLPSMRMGLIGAAALALSGCLSFKAELPTSLPTLSATSSAPAGSGATAGGEGNSGAILVMAPETPAKLDVVRVPVDVSDTEIAYLPNAIWVEKPARLFRTLLGETLRTRTSALVVDTEDSPAKIAISLRGKLLEMGYDAATSSAVVSYEAILVDGEGKAISRRFEARESGVLPEAGSVGPALNRAANTVAGDVAEWVTERE